MTDTTTTAQVVEFPKDMRSIAKLAIEQEWRVETIKSGWRFCPPDRSVAGIVVHKTPSDHRARRNMLAALKRAGLKGVTK